MVGDSSSKLSSLITIDLWEGGTVVVLTNFTIVPHLEACQNNASNGQKCDFIQYYTACHDLMSFFLIICEFQIIVKFIKTTTVRGSGCIEHNVCTKRAQEQ